MILSNRVNAILPEAASDSMRIDVPAPIVSDFCVLNTRFKNSPEVLESAVANPLTPVRSSPLPTKLVAVN